MSEVHTPPTSRITRTLFLVAVCTMGLDQYRPAFGGIGNLSDVLFGVAFLFGAISWFIRLDADRLRDTIDALRPLEPILWGGALFTLGGVIASISSDVPDASWRVTLKHFGMLCIWLPWVTTMIPRYVGVLRTTALYVGGYCVIAVMTITDVFLHTRFGGRFVSTPVYQVNFETISEGVRYGGPTGHPNTLGYMATIAILVCVATIADRGWRRAWQPALGALACGPALVAAGSRGAFLGVAFGLTVIFVAGRGEVRRRLLGVAVVGVICVAVAVRVFPLPPSINPVNRLVESMQARRGFEADYIRARDIPLSEQLLSVDPLTGYGMEDIDTPNPPTKVAFRLPHFVLLQAWVAGGALSLAGAGLLYGATLFLGWRAVRAGHSLAPGLLAATAAFMLIDQVGPSLAQRYKWFAAALLLATLPRKVASIPEQPSST